jgi:hypothetical protein
LQPGNLLISLSLTLSVGFSMSIALMLLPKLGGSWLLPPQDFSPKRVTLWITTAIHLDTPKLKLDPDDCVGKSWNESTHDSFDGLEPGIRASGPLGISSVGEHAVGIVC